MDPHWFQCRSGSAFYLNADPDPDPDPHPRGQTNADPDPCQKFKSQKVEFYMKNITEELKIGTSNR